MCVYRVASHNFIFADGCVDWFHTAEREQDSESKRESQTEKTENVPVSVADSCRDNSVQFLDWTDRSFSCSRW